MDSTRFQVNSPPVVQETIDNEVIIVNLDSGSYYSVDKVGTRIWNGIERGSSGQEIIADLARHYDTSLTEIETHVARMLAEFQQEHLISVRENAGQSGEFKPVEPEPVTSPRHPFEPPVLHKYTDMQDLLMLDPIHEVDETGWPAIKPFSSAE